MDEKHQASSRGRGTDRRIGVVLSHHAGLASDRTRAGSVSRIGTASQFRFTSGVGVDAYEPPTRSIMMNRYCEEGTWMPWRWKSIVQGLVFAAGLAAQSAAADPMIIVVEGSPGLRFEVTCRLVRDDGEERVSHRWSVPKRIRVRADTASCRIQSLAAFGRVRVDLFTPDGRHLRLETTRSYATISARSDGPWGDARLATTGGGIVDGYIRRPDNGLGPVPPLGSPLPPIGGPLPGLGPEP
jgi:hypothetical protein